MALSLRTNSSMRIFSKWQVFGMTWLGWIVAGLVFAICWYYWGEPPKEFIGPGTVLVLNIVTPFVTGLICLPLPLLASFALNGEIRGNSRLIWVRSLVQGITMFALLLVWEQEKWPRSHGWQFIKNLFAFLALFIVPLFLMARRADINLLYGNASNGSEHKENAQPSIQPIAQRRAPAEW